VKDAFAKENIVPGNITAALIRPRLSKSYVDDGKLTDHHAIIPTHNPLPANLPDKQRNVYNLVATRFLSIFLPPEVRDETIALITLAEHTFRAKGFIIKEMGWTVLASKFKDDDDDTAGGAPEKGKGKTKAKAKDKDGEDAQQLPPLVKGEKILKRKVEMKEGKTSAPKPYDDATLLTAMKNAGQELDDEDLAVYMKQKGLGTPATRAAIIERLLQTGYVERAKKALLPTEKGKALIGQVHTELKDIALTAIWEQRLADMQDGKLKPASFDSDIADLVRRILPDVTTGGVASVPPADGSSLGLCPLCKLGYVRLTPKGAGCNRWRDGCTFTIWKDQRGKELSDAQMKDLITDGQTKVIKGFKKRDGSGKYDAKLVLSADGKIQFDLGNGPIDNAGLGACPQCTAAASASGAIDSSLVGSVRLTPRGAGCSRWREGCTFTLWRTVFGKELSDEDLKALLEKKRTEVLKGFQKKDGSGTYDARLVLNSDFKVRLEFDNAPRRLEGPEPEGGAAATTAAKSAPAATLAN
jgi:DNA topoisomerase-3